VDVQAAIRLDLFPLPVGALAGSELVEVGDQRELVNAGGVTFYLHL
jgi:hypothetical protein